MASGEITKIVVVTMRERSMHFGSRTLYRSQIVTTYSDGTSLVQNIPVDVPSGPQEPQNSYHAHEQIVRNLREAHNL